MVYYLRWVGAVIPANRQYAIDEVIHLLVPSLPVFLHRFPYPCLHGTVALALQLFCIREGILPHLSDALAQVGPSVVPSRESIEKPNTISSLSTIIRK